MRNVLERDFWIRETGTGQQVAQLHDRCDDDDDDGGDDDDDDDVLEGVCKENQSTSLQSLQFINQRMHI